MPRNGAVPETPPGAPAAESTAPVGAPDGGAAALPTLAVSGVVLSKAQLVAALRVYVPAVVDIQPLADGQHFSLLFGPSRE